MEKKLTKLLDYQKFVGNPRLQSVIDSVRRYPRELSLDEAALVSAAGSTYYKPTNDEEEKHP